MAELNDKLITYGNLSTFYDKLQEQGLGGNAIEDASVLPDASANKNKLFRLESDDNVYVSELKSRTSTTTNRLPDAQQIDKAYIIYVEEGTTDNNIWYYKGLFTIIYADNTQEQFYGWYNPNIFGDGYWCLYVTSDDAEHVEMSSHYSYITNEEFAAYKTIDLVNNVITITTDKEEPIGDLSQHDTFDTENINIPIPATYNAPESAQIGNAYMDDGQTHYYTGIQKTIVCSDGSLNLYQWGDNNDEHPYFTEKQASDLCLFSDADELGVIYTDFNVAGFYVTEGWEVSGNTYTNLNVSTEDIWDIDNAWGINPIYIPQLNAPDSEQVNNAYIYDEQLVNSNFYYKGEVTAYFTDGEMTLYRWENEEDSTYSIFTNKYAAVNTYSQWAAYETFDTIELYWDSENEIWKSTQYTVSEVEEMFEGSFREGEYHIVKYQRTETTEEWDWQPLTDNATNDDIDAMFNEIKLIRAQEDDENYIDWLVNTGGETMVFNGQTYYKWAVWCNDFNDGSGPAEEHPNMVVLTNTLNVQLPFNSDSPEFEYRISIDGEEMISRNYIHGDYTQKTVQ